LIYADKNNHQYFKMLINLALLAKYLFNMIMGKLVEEFDAYRTKMNDRIMETANTNIKRFFALDTTSYADGALDVKTKEMLGLVASMVLRCDDCIKYHLGKCHEAGVNHDEMNEIFMIANLVGGSIVIPHYRRAVEYWDELNEAK
jgi:AhpD family alkylhydroperoxidase